MASIEKRKIFEKTAHLRGRYICRNIYYYSELKRFYQFHIPNGQRVLEVGCGNGDLLAALLPAYGVGIDFCEPLIKKANEKHPGCRFIIGDVESMPLKGKFDYIIISDVLEHLDDIQSFLTQLQLCCHDKTRIICNFFNHAWEPVLRLGEITGLKMPNPVSNWLSMRDMENIFYLSGFEVISRCRRMLFPRRIPLFSYLLNYLIAILPFINKLCLVQCLILRKQPGTDAKNADKYSVSIIIPTRDEAGTISECFTRMPKMGKWTELIFVDGNSADGTIEAIEKGIKIYSNRWHRAILLHQGGKFGKADAVRKGFANAKGDILMILDSDLTMPPEDLPKYYDAIATRRGDFINGCRLIYPMEKQAMRFINYFGNKVFSIMFTWLINQHIKDTLCGTKVLWRNDYESIADNRSFFGDFDPFGDFDLIFGAAKLDLKIVDMPIRYRERVYGDIKIERWKHALLLFRMCWTAFYRLKLQRGHK